jgi:mitochondrial fission protein ELM1
MSEMAPRIWLLLGPRPGDNNQALALGDALGEPYAVKTLAYNWLQKFSLWLPPTLASLLPEYRANLRPPWPKVVVAVGRRSVPIARWIRWQSGGVTQIVRIGHPRNQAQLFDLVITTRQYLTPKGDNVVLLPVTMSRYVPPPAPNEREQDWIDTLPRPVRLVAIGGPTKYWTLTTEKIVRALDVDIKGCAVAVVSRRTPKELVARLRGIAAASPRVSLVEGDFPSFSALLCEADEIFVTGDSISMISEAVQAGKPVAIVPVERDSKGARRLADVPLAEGRGAHRRDLRRFWDYLVSEGLAGTLESGARRSDAIPRPTETAAKAVRRLLGDL